MPSFQVVKLTLFKTFQGKVKGIHLQGLLQ